MAYCENCGNKIVEGSKFCGVCGAKVCEEDRNDATYEKVCEASPAAENKYQEDGPVVSKKDRFVRIGKPLAIAGFICSFIPFLNLYTVTMSVVGLVFCIISGTSPNEDVRSSSRSGKIFGILGIVLSIVIFIIAYAILLSFSINSLFDLYS